MGIPYELNWYLVVADNSQIKEEDSNTFITTKSQHRIYPINSEIPLIIKDKGCIGIVTILSFTVNREDTIIKFEYMKKLDITDAISKHYYDMYIHMKNK